MIDLIFRRPIFPLAIVVMAQVMLLAYQIKGDHDVRLIRYWAVALITPIERVGTWSTSKVGGAWSGYVGLHNARSENNNMHAELDQLRIQNRELESRAAEAGRLEAILKFRDEHPEAQMLAAQVIGSSADPTSHTLFINRGDRDHLRVNLSVITSEGIVGKIVEVLPNPSQVLLINDKDSGVGGKRRRRPGAAHGIRGERREGDAGRGDCDVGRGSHFPEGPADWDGAGGESGKSVSDYSGAARGAAGPAGRRDCAAEPATAYAAEIRYF